MRAVGYIRVSTEEQSVGGSSMAQQRSAIEAYCVLQHYELVQIYEDAGVSAGKPLSTRPAGAALLKDIAQVDVVVALKLDRLFRDAIDALEVVREWDRQEKALCLVDMGGQPIDTRSAIGRFFLHMLAAFAELERNVISERTRAVLQHKKAKGEVVGQIPYGYAREGDRLIEDPVEQKVLQLMVEMEGDGVSQRAIVEILNQTGAVCRGGRWHQKTVWRLLWRLRLLRAKEETACDR